MTTYKTKNKNLSTMAHSTFPLSEAQQGMMLEWLQHPGLTQYNVNVYYRCSTMLDTEKLRRCLQTVFCHHDVFYTHIKREGKELCQYIDRTKEIRIDYFEIADSEFDNFKNDYVKPFNIFEDILTRAAIVKTEKNIYIIFDISHLIFDSVSATMLWNELCCEYADAEHLFCDCAYSAYVDKEIKALQSEDYVKAAEYYETEFEGMSMTKIPSKHSEAIGHFKNVVLDMAKTDVENFCHTNGCTPNILFMAAYSIALSAFSGTSTSVFYSLNHGRTNHIEKQTFGMFVKTVPFKGDLTNQEMLVHDYLCSLHRQMMNNIRYGVYPFTHFCRDLHCLPENSFNFHIVQRNVTIGGEKAHMQQFFSGNTMDNISAQVWDLGNNYQITIDYNDQRYSEWLMRQFAHAMQDIVMSIISIPDARMKDLKLVSDQRAAEILAIGQGNPLPPSQPGESRFMDMFRRQVQLLPDNIAIVDERGCMTYSELDHQSSCLASQIIGKEHILPDDIVTIMLPRNRDFMIAVLAVMKAGACYVPLSLDYPAERIKYIRDNSKSKLHIDAEYMMNFAAQKDEYNSTNEFRRGDYAYIIYTSGSTGNPKGVLISQKALYSFIRTCQYTYGLTATDRILCHDTFSFDASVEDLFPILATGGQLHILPEEKRKDLNAIKEYIIANSITGGNYTTAFGELLLMSYPDLPLRYITLGGEKLDKVPDNVTCRFFNSYGPTEFTVDATFWEYTPGKDKTHVPIGRPVNDGTALVLDSYQRLLPQGCPGYLYLAGPQIATGYWNNKEATAANFINNPFQSSEDTRTMYSTGDIVSWNEDGDLEFVGRKDEQIKLNGYRIETAEVVSAIMKVDGIRQVHVGVIESHGKKHLCAWYTSLRNIEQMEISSAISKLLPKYFMPDMYVHMDSFPVTPNGKIDRKKLPLPKIQTVVHKIVPPATESERFLVNIVAETIGETEIGVTDDLFDDLNVSSLDIATIAFHASAKGHMYNVTTFYEQRTIRNVVRSCSCRTPYYWAGEYDPTKPVVILICGYVYMHPLYDNLVNFFKKSYSIYVIDAFHENFMWKEHVSCDILIDEYVEAYKRDLIGKNIHHIMGTCFGADIAIPFVQRIEKELGIRHRLLAFEPIYSRKGTADTVPYEKDPSDALIEQYRISHLLGESIPIPTYKGPMIIVSSSKATNRKYVEYDDIMTEEEVEQMRQFIKDNDRQWDEHFPDVPKYKIPGDHYTFLETANMPMIEDIIHKHWD